MSKIIALLVVSALVDYAFAGYRLVDNYSGNSFFDNWSFWNAKDPTNGYVYYATREQCNQWGYTYVSNNVVYIKSDSSSVSSGSGRGSVRLTSNKVYNKGLFIIDVQHMPTGCGNWPAIWTVGPNWPYGGEIDIIEGVNKQTKNQMTLHTGPGCTMPANWNSVGQSLGLDCNSANGANGNAGCAILSTDTRSFGTDFNNNGGGVWAMQWENSGIFIWFWRRGSVPADVTNGNPNTAGWGVPAASFPFAGTGPGSCASSQFRDQQIVIDNTFCGDWAGNTFNNDGCSGSCQSFVQNNPGQFAQAYWAINSIKVYQQ